MCSDILKNNELTRFVSTMAGMYKDVQGRSIHVTVEPDITSPCTTMTDRKVNIKLPAQGEYNESNQQALMYYTYRQLYHFTHGESFDREMSDSGLVDAQGKSTGAFGVMAKQIEEYRVQNQGAEDYLGVKGSFGKHAVLDINKRLIPMGLNESEMSKEDSAIVAVSTLCQQARQGWGSDVEAAVDELLLEMPSNVKDDVRKLRDAGLLSKIEMAETSEDSINIARQAFINLLEYTPPEDEPPPQPSDGKGDGSGEGESGKPPPSHGKAGDGDEEGNGGGSAAEGGEGDTDEGETGRGDMKENIYDTLEGMAREATQVEGTGIGIDYEPEQLDRSTYLPTPDHEAIVYDREVPKRSRNNGRKDEEPHSGYYEDLVEPDSKFGNKVRRLLQARSQSRYVRNKEEGRLDKAKAYRAALPTIGDGAINKRIYKKKKVNDTLDRAITVLADVSGSMSGAKASTLVAALRMLNTSISKELGMPLEILTFTESSRSLLINVIKTHGKKCDDHNLTVRVCTALNRMSMNGDADAILMAYNRLMPRKEAGKTLIVLSDGSPSSRRAGDCYTHTKNVIKEIEETSPIDIIGIGIEDDNVVDLYSNSVVINRADELQSALIETLKRSILNEHK